MPIALVHDNIDKIVARRKAKADARRTGSRLRKVWQEILTPLQAHIQSVLVHQPEHQEGNPPYHAFNQKYLRLLRTLRDTMKDHLAHGYSPRESLNTMNLHTNRTSLEGVTWTWWLDEETKQKVLARYAQLPRTNKTNYRTLFPEPKANTMPKVRQKIQNDIMSEITDAEMEMRSPHINDTGKEYFAQRIAMLNEALTRLDNLPRKAVTPKRYEGLFKAIELYTNYPLVYPREDAKPLTPTEGEEA
jgi:uncharacterized small protein (DUF1192 family)